VPGAAPQGSLRICRVYGPLAFAKNARGCCCRARRTNCDRNRVAGDGLACQRRNKLRSEGVVLCRNVSTDAEIGAFKAGPTNGVFKTVFSFAVIRRIADPRARGVVLTDGTAIISELNFKQGQIDHGLGDTVPSNSYIFFSKQLK